MGGRGGEKEQKKIKNKSKTKMRDGDEARNKCCPPTVVQVKWGTTTIT